jgi:hypothetical protein
MTRASGPRLQAATIGVALLVLVATVMASPTHAVIAAAVLIAVVLAIWTPKVLASWPRLIAGLLLVVMLIPIDRYTVAGGSLPFQLEPYRIVLAVLILGWIASLLVDNRVQIRKTGFEGPLGLIVFATLGSELANPSRVSSLSSYVLKAVWFFLFFLAFVYLGVSLIRSRAVLERLLTLLVGAGCFVAVDAVLQRRLGFDVFDHLKTLIPILSYTPVATGSRQGYTQAVASSSHPLELTVVMTMLIPLAIYLGVSRRQKLWFAGAALLLLGMLSTGERTAVVGLMGVVIVGLWLRRKQTLSLWPLLIPGIILVELADPGALGALKAELFPAGGIIAEQQHQVLHSKLTYGNRLAQIGPTITEWSHHNPLFGEGYGTRVTGYDVKFTNAPILDDQWLDTLLETGLLGVVGWIWLFARVIRRLGARAKLETESNEGWLAWALAASTLVFALAMATFDAFSFTQGTFLMFTIITFAAVALQLPRDRAPGIEMYISEPRGELPRTSAAVGASR